MTCFLSGDKKMYEAYTHGQDLYAMIAQSAYHNEYGDNLEFYVPGKVVDIDGKKVVSGSGKEFETHTDENDSIVIKYYELLETTLGEKSAEEISINDKIVSDIGNLRVINKAVDGDNVTLTFAQEQ